MGTGRETASIWWYLFGKFPSGRWRGYRLFQRRFWKHPYLLHDSFGKYWNRLIGCRLFGHRHMRNIADHGKELDQYCFNCERHI